MLDSAKDTNFIKINKAFLGPGDPFQIAMIDDSCNYPNKLDARIIEYRSEATGNHYQQTRVLPLDTVTIHNKENGLFYAPDQLVYYTKEKINNNSSRYNYRYELQIDRGDTLITSVTDMVGGSSFTIINAQMDLSASGQNGTIKWYPCPNAAVYELVVRFNFIELTPSMDSIKRYMTWSLGTYPEAILNKENNAYFIKYKPSSFIPSLASFLGSDTLKNVERLISEPSLVLSIAAGGEELYNFISVNGPSNSIVQNIPEYTNVNGGYGVFSSRTLLEKRVRLNSQALIDITEHDNWRFRQIK